MSTFILLIYCDPRERFEENLQKRREEDIGKQSTEAEDILQGEKLRVKKHKSKE